MAERARRSPVRSQLHPEHGYAHRPWPDALPRLSPGARAAHVSHPGRNHPPYGPRLLSSRALRRCGRRPGHGAGVEDRACFAAWTRGSRVGHRSVHRRPAHRPGHLLHPAHPRVRLRLRVLDSRRSLASTARRCKKKRGLRSRCRSRTVRSALLQTEHGPAVFVGGRRRGLARPRVHAHPARASSR